MVLQRMQQRRYTAAEWTSGNEVLLPGELGIELDTSKWKLGNGTTAWTGLPYQPSSAAITAQINAVINSAPGALDTLKELADALGDDPNYATTVTNALAAKANTASLAPVATAGTYSSLTGKPTLGTAAAAATGDFDAVGAATAAQGYAVQRTNHTGTQTASTISDIQTTITGNTDVAANTAVRHSHANKSTLDNVTAAYTTAEQGRLAGVDQSMLTTQHETIPRFAIITNTVATSTQRLMFSFFTARSSVNPTGIRIISGGTAAAATPTLIRFGLYALSGTTLTLIASTASDTTLLATANTSYTKAFTVQPGALTPGVRYGIGLLVVTAATAPTLPGVNPNGFTAEYAQPPILSGYLAAQSDLPASTATTSLTQSAALFYAVAY